MAIYQPPKQYEAKSTGSTISSVGGIVAAVPTPYTKAIGGAMSLVGSLMNAGEQRKVQESQDAIARYEDQYAKRQEIDRMVDISKQENLQNSTPYGFRSSMVRKDGTSLIGMKPQENVPFNGGTGLINNRLM